MNIQFIENEKFCQLRITCLLLNTKYQFPFIIMPEFYYESVKCTHMFVAPLEPTK